MTGASSPIKFVSELPPREARKRPEGRWASVRAALRTNQGVWAEIARFSKADRQAAYGLKTTLPYHSPDIESETRAVGDEVVVFARSKKEGE